MEVGGLDGYLVSMSENTAAALAMLAGAADLESEQVVAALIALAFADLQEERAGEVVEDSLMDALREWRDLDR